jgi:hypothetical protein
VREVAENSQLIVACDDRSDGRAADRADRSGAAAPAGHHANDPCGPSNLLAIHDFADRARTSRRCFTADAATGSSRTGRGARTSCPMARWGLDRLLDERHAGLGEAVSRSLTADGWEVVPEVSFSIFGERGSIDLLAWHAATRTLLVIELKSELTSIEETLRRHDAKVRLASRIAEERFGWRPVAVGRLLVLPEGRTPRRHVERHTTLFQRSYPARNVTVRRWLRDPAGLPIAGLWFLSASDGASAMRVAGPRKRIRGAKSAKCTHEPMDRATSSPPIRPTSSHTTRTSGK